MKRRIIIRLKRKLSEFAAVAKSVRWQISEEGVDELVRWLDGRIAERAVPRDEYREVLSRMDILEHDVSDIKVDLRGLRREMGEIMVVDRTELQISVVIPVYNEEEAISDDLDTIIATMEGSGYTYEVIVVDDGSTDRTADIARAKGVKVVRHPINRGSGASRRTGILQARGEIIVMTDGDGTYPNQDIPHLLEYLPAFDQVVGARTSEQGSFRFLRAPAKWFIRKLACYLTGMDIPDLNSGLRAFKREIMLKFLYLLPDGFSCVSTMTLAFLCNGYTIKYVPINYYKRKGQSKFHPVRDTGSYLLTVVRMVMYFNPLKVFLPMSLFLLSVGSVKMIYDIFTYNFHFAPSTVMLILTGVQIGAIGLLADLIVTRDPRGKG